MNEAALHDPTTNRALVQECAKQFLRDSGSKLTEPRIKLLEAIFSSREHFSAEDLHRRLAQSGSRVSIATVYRLINELVKGHFLRPLDDGTERKQFDSNHPTAPGHYHILCKDCGKMIGFEDPCLDLRERALVRDKGFVAEKLQVRVDASCKRQHESGDCPNKEAGGEISGHPTTGAPHRNAPNHKTINRRV